MFCGVQMGRELKLLQKMEKRMLDIHTCRTVLVVLFVRKRSAIGNFHTFAASALHTQQ
jgi:hypothetical protein